MSIAEKLQTIAENEQRVYDAGYAKGQAEGGDTTAAYDEGFEAGKKAEYDAFWDLYQNNGNRTDYRHGFAGTGWTPETFKPKYDIKPTQTGAYMMFYQSEMSGDLVQLLDACGVELDLSGINGWAQYVFASSKLTRLGRIDFTNVSTMASTFADSPIHTIDELIITQNCAEQSAFLQCADLVNLKIGGVIGKNGFNFQWSTKLTHDSLMSIINALKDNSGTSTWNTITLGADNLAKLTNEEKQIMNTKQWEYS